MEMFRESRPKTFRILYYALWVFAPIEMCCIKLGIFGYKKLRINEYNKSVMENMK